MRIQKIVLLALVAVGLNACTGMQTRRGVTGAALGSAAGVGLSAIAGGDVVSGALVGAAAGAAIGVSTTPVHNHYQAPPPQPRRRYYQQQNNYYYDSPPPRRDYHDRYYYR
jgi:hypothetical protein